MSDASESKTVGQLRRVVVEYRKCKGKPQRPSRHIYAYRYALAAPARPEVLLAHDVTEMPNVAPPVPTGSKPSQTKLVTHVVDFGGNM